MTDDAQFYTRKLAELITVCVQQQLALEALAAYTCGNSTSVEAFNRNKDTARGLLERILGKQMVLPDPYLESYMR